MSLSLSRTDSLEKLTPQYLRDNYLLGLDFVDATNKPYPETFYQQKLQVALSQFENFTQVTVDQLLITDEPHDYHVNDYRQYAYIQLFHYPVLITDTIPGPVVSAQYPAGTTLTTFPKEWIKTERSHGAVRMLPSSGTMSSVMMTLSGQCLPAIYAGGSFLPGIWAVTYTAGFEKGKVPALFIDAIAKLAAIEILSVLGNSVYPPGIQSSSIGADGLSTSKSIIAGPDTAPVFSGTIKQYKNDLYGMPSQGIMGLFADIKDHYRGMTMTVLG